jgi:hypothetical protein
MFLYTLILELLKYERIKKQSGYKISSHSIQYMKGLVDGNYRVEIYIHFIRPNQEQLRKMQLYRPCDSAAAL